MAHVESGDAQEEQRERDVWGPKCRHGFTPFPACTNCGGTGEFSETEACHFCLSDAIRAGELDGVADGIEYKGGKPTRED